MQRRTFVTGGPVVPSENYLVPRERELADFLDRVRSGKYIVIFAPQQTGKTTFFFRALKQLAQDASYIPIWIDFQIYSEAASETFYRHFMQRARLMIKGRLKEIELSRYTDVADWMDGQNVTDHLSFQDFFGGLHAQLPETKICIIIDEFDGIPKDALRNFLYTFREIYNAKKLSNTNNYLHSVGIVGVKSIAQLDFDRSISPFNIQDRFALPNFTREQTANLYEQYTEETGQALAPEVIEAVHHKTAGQPFLVNQLGQILTVELGVDTTETITLEHFRKVYRRLPNDNNTHFQHLRRNINRKPEFKRILNCIMFDDREFDFNINDVLISELNTYGIVRENEEGICVIDNPIYQEIIIKTFTPTINGIEDEYLPESGEDFIDYLSEEGKVQMDVLLDNFCDFIERIGYRILEVPKTPQEFVGQYLLLTYLDLFA